MRPLEDTFKFGNFFSPLMTESDFEAKPSVLLLGQYSTGDRVWHCPAAPIEAPVMCLRALLVFLSAATKQEPAGMCRCCDERVAGVLCATFSCSTCLSTPLSHLQLCVSPPGKTTFIKYLLGRDYPGSHIGPEPTTDRFVVVYHGLEERRCAPAAWFFA